MLFHEIIRGIRKELNITQEQLAYELHISFTTLNRWENGRTTPSRLAKLRLLEYGMEHNVTPELLDKLEKCNATTKIPVCS